MNSLRRIYLVTAPGLSAVVVAPDPVEARSLAWFGSDPFAEVYLLGVACDGVPRGRVGYLDVASPELIAALRAASGVGQGSTAPPS